MNLTPCFSAIVASLGEVLLRLLVISRRGKASYHCFLQFDRDERLLGVRSRGAVINRLVGFSADLI